MTRKRIGGGRATMLLTVGALAVAACGGAAPYVDTDGSAAAPAPDVVATTTPPVDLPEFSGVTAGETHTCAIDRERVAWCWGANRYGQLGDGTVENRARPVTVAGEIRFRTLSAGTSHTCGVDIVGGAWCWGGNFVGKLGNGTTESSTVPVPVDGLPVKVDSIHAGTDRSCAVGDDGSLWCWGLNHQNQLADLGDTEFLTPVRLREAGTREFSLIGGRGCYLGDGADVGCYGNDIKSYAETGAIVSYRHDIVGAPSGLRSLAQTRAQSCTIDGDDYIVCWGGTVHNQGEATHGVWQAPRRQSDVTARTLASAESTMCFIKDSTERDDVVRCWGLRPPGAWFQPNAIGTMTPWDVTGLQGKIVAIDGGGAHLCAVNQAGTLWCWGWNEYGQLGDGSLRDAVDPVRVN